MTEQEWLTATDPMSMLEFLRGKVSERKLRLWACACSRRKYWSDDPEFGQALAVAELWADGEKPNDLGSLNDYYICDDSAWAAAYEGTAQQLAGHTESLAKSWKQLTQFYVATLWDIFGNPFHPITLNPHWLTSTVLALANGIYSEKAFDRMPILADALQDAGCDNEDIFNHCRKPGEHVRGCWVIDLLTCRK